MDRRLKIAIWICAVAWFGVTIPMNVMFVKSLRCEDMLLDRAISDTDRCSPSLDHSDTTSARLPDHQSNASFLDLLDNVVCVRNRCV
jgi:hypothetical protein